MSDNAEKHPTYATLTLSKTSNGDPVSLFGSKINHRNTISLVISHAELNRNYSMDHYVRKDPIIEVEMSYIQFTEAIASMNLYGDDVYDDVPCTIRYTETEGELPRYNFAGNRDQFELEFSDHMDALKEETHSAIQHIEKILTKKTIGKADRTFIVSLLNDLYLKTTVQTGFISEQFSDQIDKAVQEAKEEIEVFYQKKLHSMSQIATEARQSVPHIENPVNLD